MGMSTTQSTAPKDALTGLKGALRSVANYSENSLLKTMNVDLMENHTHMSATLPQHDERVSPTSKYNFLSWLIPPLLQGRQGLSNIPNEKLRESLYPIILALQKLDANLLLGLEKAAHGPRVQDGAFCRPIYDDVLPPVAGANCTNGQSCVRYLHIAEVPDQYSIGVFVFAANARIPLHDHPEMCVLSRVLYGDLQRLSLDLVREKHFDSHMGEKRSTWLGSLWNKLESFRSQLPQGTKRALKNHVDHLQAPDVTVLFPYEGNLHEFVAGPNGAAVLDVLLPPYDNTQNRDCTFFEIQDLASSLAIPSGKEPCFVVPTGQPEDFHCLSGQYRNLGDPGS